MYAFKGMTRYVVFFFITLSCQSVLAKGGEDSFWTALTGGKADFNARYRYEHVDDDIGSKEADASTIRTTLGYNTGKLHGFGGRLMLQDVRTVFVDDFNDATGRPGAKTQFAVVADPSETDFLEGYLSYSGSKETILNGTTMKLGRQIITYRADPFHRFMGTVVWRQNWQNHDAVSLVNKSLPNTRISYAYSWNVNRIFTDEAIGALANWDSNSHFINIQYDGLSFGKLEGYSYLMDFDNSAANSTATYGIRLNGGIPVTDTAKAIYTAEFAKQTDYGNNPANVNENYILGEIGAKFKFNSPLSSLTFKFSYELLGGNGSTSFRTPLATGHAYQGWNDRFLTTPADGIADYIYTLVARIWGTKFMAIYHDLDADNLGYDYGGELNLLLSKTFKKHYTLSIKYGDYDADRNTTNIANNGTGSGVTNDVNKYWAWAQIKF